MIEDGESALDRLHPERVRVRELRTVDDYQSVWELIETLWGRTLARAERLPGEDMVYEQVDGEWSLVQTLRHLVFATDLWAGHMILSRPEPFHPLGLPPTDYPAEDLAALPLAASADPSYAEVLVARALRLATVRGIVARLSPEELGRVSEGALPAAWNEPPLPVSRCLRVVMRDEVEHRRYAERDLAVLEERVAAG